jgi:hypothetical protein
VTGLSCLQANKAIITEKHNANKCLSGKKCLIDKPVFAKLNAKWNYPAKLSGNCFPFQPVGLLHTAQPYIQRNAGLLPETVFLMAKPSPAKVCHAGVGRCARPYRA